MRISILEEYVNFHLSNAEREIIEAGAGGGPYEIRIEGGGVMFHKTRGGVRQVSRSSVSSFKGGKPGEDSANAFNMKFKSSGIPNIHRLPKLKWTVFDNFEQRSDPFRHVFAPLPEAGDEAWSDVILRGPRPRKGTVAAKDQVVDHAFVKATLQRIKLCEAHGFTFNREEGGKWTASISVTVG